MRFQAIPGPASVTGWCGTGEADLSVEPAGADWRIVEQGHFLGVDATRTVAFRNVYRWQRLADGIALSHERFGAEAAVFLFDLVDAGDGRLITRDAHHCGADRYDAVLTPTADGFTLDWTIHGPAKDERLCYHYSLAPADTHHG